MSLGGSAPSRDLKDEMTTGPNTKHRVVPLPRFRRQMIDWLDLEHRKHATYILGEFEVTKTREAIREYRARNGGPLSMTAFLTGCLSRAIAEHLIMHAYRKDGPFGDISTTST